MLELTKKQEEVLNAIKELYDENHIMPTLVELKDYLGYSAISSVQRHIISLKKKGFLASEKHKGRGLKIIEKVSKYFQIPLVGNVTCGLPMLAMENIEAYIPLKVDGNPKDYFCLRAVGDSMNKKGIEDGSIVLVKKQSVASNGDVVVALIGDDATIKTYKKDIDKVILEPESENPIHKPIYLFENFQIQGKVVKTI